MAVSAGTTRESGPALATRALSCIVTRECPTGWDTLIARCDGGFFHAPPGNDLGGLAGEPVFLRLFSGKEVIGIVAGARRACRITSQPRHFYFPTLPALAAGIRPGLALDVVIDALRTVDAAEITMESFDAHWSAETTMEPTETRMREEYVVPLTTTPGVMAGALASGHRRQIRKADKNGWRIEHPEGDEARAILTSVQEVAAQRAAARGNRFEVRVPSLVALDGAGVRPWGATMFVARHEDGLLAAALVGWANARAFYVMGGSTPAGYECGASLWLHWRIACLLGGAGFRTYNLGGASPDAATPGHPAHGLYRFKMGFGARAVPCRSMSWVLSTAHQRVHQLGRWLGHTLSSVTQET